MTLKALGFDVEEASTGEEALALLAAGGYDVVLLDIEMPGISGIETCREVQKLSSPPAVVMLTVRDGDEDKIRAFEAGAQAYLTKPFQLHDLLEHIRTARRGP